MNAFERQLWENYIEITPAVEKVKHILGLENNQIFSDHIAFRSIASTDYGIKKLCMPFLKRGYKIKVHYRFEEKKLRAVHLESDFASDAKIFISELMLNHCSPFLKEKITEAFNHLHPDQDNILTAGRKWEVQYKTYRKLEKESEYAAWLYIHGLRVNHFTLNVNELGYSIELLCRILKDANFTFNEFGGIIKGSREEGLKQASLMADDTLVEFEDLEYQLRIPSCYVEFAERFTIKGSLFNGFIAKSANNIFESTNTV